MLDAQNDAMTDAAHTALAEYIMLRRGQPHFANARSIRNKIDGMRLRQASRLFETASGPLDRAALSTIEEGEVRASRVLRGVLDADREPAG